ncbi:MAG: hypothetical protein VKJ64_07685, partial [Leptolyngbyaceae bacterium]|nr:hypothetical protein [Leptolyngbyaceae bacterium]
SAFLTAFPSMTALKHNNNGSIHHILNRLMLKMAEVLYQAGELNEALACYRQVIWCHNQKS